MGVLGDSIGPSRAGKHQRDSGSGYGILGLALERVMGEEHDFKTHVAEYRNIEVAPPLQPSSDSLVTAPIRQRTRHRRHLLYATHQSYRLLFELKRISHLPSVFHPWQPFCCLTQSAKEDVSQGQGQWRAALSSSALVILVPQKI